MRATQFFEFIKRIADSATEGNTVRLPSVGFQPLAADDVAKAVAKAAVGSPLDGIVELGGPEKFRSDEMIRMGLNADKDEREVVADPHARYFGTELSERSLVPDEGVLLGETRFERLAQWDCKSARSSCNCFEVIRSFLCERCSLSRKGLDESATPA